MVIRYKVSFEEGCCHTSVCIITIQYLSDHKIFKWRHFADVGLYRLLNIISGCNFMNCENIGFDNGMFKGYLDVLKGYGNMDNVIKEFVEKTSCKCAVENKSNVFKDEVIDFIGANKKWRKLNIDDN